MKKVSKAALFVVAAAPVAFAFAALGVSLIVGFKVVDFVRGGK